MSKLFLIWPGSEFSAPSSFLACYDLSLEELGTRACIRRRKVTTTIETNKDSGFYYHGLRLLVYESAKAKP